jgi:hypothetical protein
MPGYRAVRILNVAGPPPLCNADLAAVPSLATLERELRKHEEIVFDIAGLDLVDTTFLRFLLRLRAERTSAEPEPDVIPRTRSETSHQFAVLDQPFADDRHRPDLHAAGTLRYRCSDQGLRSVRYRRHDQNRIARVARTIADLASSDAISREHVAEALGYRAADA